MAGKKPHILLLIDDEHRPDVMSVEGNKVIRTPTLNHIIDQGSYFRSAYTPAPVCVPARQSFLSGLYPSNSGCMGFDNPLPSGTLTIPGHLSRHGYYTVGAGKMHFVGPDQMHGWHERIGRGIYGRNGFELPDPNKTPTADSIRLAQSLSRKNKANTSKLDKNSGTGKWSGAKEIQNARAGKGYWLQHDEYTVDGALMLLDEYFVGEPYDRPKENPLLMAVSLSCPHYPYQCPEDLFSHYLTRVEPFVEDLPANFDCHDFFKIKIGKDVTYREARRATAAYYGMIEWVDSQYRRVIDKLDALNVLDDFIIVFLSDHGEMLGQKGLWEKQQYFEASVRVPFSISCPDKVLKQQKTIKENVSLVDLFPTLCELADIPIPAGLDGKSLVPLMQGKSPEWSNEVYSELYHPFNGPSIMVKENSLKYFRFEGKGWPEQLFDLASDPEENHNLLTDPAYTEDLKRLQKKADNFLRHGKTKEKAAALSYTEKELNQLEELYTKKVITADERNRRRKTLGLNCSNPG